VVTPPGVFHWGFNLGPNIHEAWNMTSHRWSQLTEKSFCDCGTIPDPPRIAFSKFLNGVYYAKLLQGLCKNHFHSLNYSVLVYIDISHSSVHIESFKNATVSELFPFECRILRKKLPVTGESFYNQPFIVLFLLSSKLENFPSVYNISITPLHHNCVSIGIESWYF
jgi:hypothetical protein